MEISGLWRTSQIFPLELPWWQ